MVMPGFYVQDRVLRCKVLCRHKSVPWFFFNFQWGFKVFSLNW
jgi:hypothetical protein